MDKDISRVQHHQSSKRKKCKICKKRCDKRGFKKHYAACEKNKAADERWEALQAEDTNEESEGEKESRQRSRKRQRRGTISSADPLPKTHEATTSLDEEHRSPGPLPAPSSPPVPSSLLPEQGYTPGNPPSTPHPSPPLSPPPTQLNASSSSAPTATNEKQPTPNLDDIRVEYHPKSTHKTTVYPFERYCQERPKTDFAATLDEPWRPFETRGDFEFAELVHEAHMSHDAIERLLKLVRDVQTGEADLTFNSHSDLRRAWDNASHFYPTFSQSIVSAEYKKENIQFDFHHRPLWGWLVSQVEDPKLAPYFHWDAQRLYKFNGIRWVRFWEEPWAADMFWQAQTHITGTDKEGKPLGLIIWADKNKMSTFGTQKAHPIVVRISNLDSTVRNGTGPGGGRIVGLVPMIEETAAEKGKKPYIDWKHAIYHDAFRILLEQVATNSRTGYRLMCGDNQARTIYPFVHIITADYEEQCFFVLTRGLHGLAPCPVCLVPEGELSNLKAKYAEREEDHAQKLVEKSEGKMLKEAKIKLFGLRAVKERS